MKRFRGVLAFLTLALAVWTPGLVHAQGLSGQIGGSVVDISRGIVVDTSGRAYVAGIDYWTWDGSHLTETGSWLTADYVSRWMAAIEHRPCPRPWGPGGPTFDPCPNPDSVGLVPNVRALY